MERELGHGERENNDGGGRVAERMISVVEFIGQKTAQAERGHGRD